MYGDIVRVDVVDTYGDLSLKTLKLFATLPSKIDADFYFKVDDDVAVNVDAMAKYLGERRSQGNLYLVCTCCCQGPIRPYFSCKNHTACGSAEYSDWVVVLTSCAIVATVIVVTCSVGES